MNQNINLTLSNMLYCLVDVNFEKGISIYITISISEFVYMLDFVQ